MSGMIPTSIPALRRSWYRRSISEFQIDSDDQVLAELVRRSEFPVLQSQRDAWLVELSYLRKALNGNTGMLYLEFSIPRMGRRIDAIVMINGIIIIIEFKIGADKYSLSDIDQVHDYAIDLKYFHEASHKLLIVPVLVASHIQSKPILLTPHRRVDGLYQTVCTNAADFKKAIDRVIIEFPRTSVDPATWESSRYCPTPTIIEAARALYAGHNVADISRNDAGAINLRDTSELLVRIIERSKASNQKAICFVTGVPGAGKTLVGLNIATKYNDANSELHSVFLSGNGRSSKSFAKP
jgi:hypothetical protein